MVTVDSVRNLSNNIKFARLCNRDYDSEFEKGTGKIGTTLSVRKPPRYQAVQDIVANIQAEVDTVATITYANPWNVTVALNSIELGYSFEKMKERISVPAAIQIANKIDSAGLKQMVNNSFMYVGAPGTALTSSLTTNSAIGAILSAKVALDRNGAPMSGNRHLLVDPVFEATLAQSAAPLYNPQSTISEIWKSGKFMNYGGFEIYADQLVPTHTYGTYTGTITTQTSGTAQTGSTINIAGLTGTSGLNVGDIFTVAGVYGVNPQTQDTGTWLQPFTVTTAFSTSSSTQAVTVSPSIVASGAFQNVSQAIPNSASVTVIGASTVSSQLAYAFHKDAVLFTNTALPDPEPGSGAVGASFTEPETGLTISSTRFYNGILRQHFFRQDCMAAFAPLYPQLSSVIYTS
jgi:hypothetical protein